ncbi:MAG: hypothetical protein KME31_04070 [Tolypothrix carrinoi HA7290-LM1]|nr:hypothetical protein [Tolypothrix carrinoi HA7290-LM1]
MTRHLHIQLAALHLRRNNNTSYGIFRALLSARRVECKRSLAVLKLVISGTKEAIALLDSAVNRKNVIKSFYETNTI